MMEVKRKSRMESKYIKAAGWEAADVYYAQRTCINAAVILRKQAR